MGLKEFGKDFGNRLGNSFGVLTRVPGSAINGVVDTISAPLFGALNFGERIGTRSAQIKEAIKNASTTGPNRKRWIRRPLAVTSGAVSYLTGGVRALLASSRDAIGGIFQAVGNTFNNVGSSILRMGEKKPIKDFSFAKLQPEKAEMNSVLTRRFPAITTTPAPKTP